MKIYVNDQEVDLIKGMSVRQALTQAGLFEKIEKGARVYDAWGNETGLDGALEEGARLTVKAE
ncbi:MAG: hypothetical protein AB1585_10335 [Thermodesulfobacteriota bacterium]